ncbi:MAG: hypothetical protein KAJ75_04305, partial [Alphaproteobacteria bacterium]|nr:hypothetical protein [Alphaproteobacteria bacterium]
MKKISSKQKIKLILLWKAREPCRLKRPKNTNKDLRLPSNLDFSVNYEKTMAFFNEFRERALKNGERIRLNFSYIRGISPAASLVLIAEIYRCWKYHDRKIWTTGRKQCQISQQLQEMGFYALLGAKSSNKKTFNSSNKQYIHFETETKDVGRLADKIRQAIYNECPTSFSEQTKDMLYKGLIESMSNVSRHAYNEQFKEHIAYPYNDRRWWMSGYIDKDKHEVMIQFY